MTGLDRGRRAWKVHAHRAGENNRVGRLVRYVLAQVAGRHRGAEQGRAKSAVEQVGGNQPRRQRVTVALDGGHDHVSAFVGLLQRSGKQRNNRLNSSGGGVLFGDEVVAELPAMSDRRLDWCQNLEQNRIERHPLAEKAARHVVDGAGVTLESGRGDGELDACQFAVGGSHARSLRDDRSAWRPAVANDPGFKFLGLDADCVNVHNEEFESVLTGAVAGAPWAWNRLYTSLSPTLLGYLRARGAKEAEDILGEVWLNVARRLATFVGDHDGFRSWVFMIAHHRLIDERRKLGRQPMTQSTDGADVLEGHMAEADAAMAGMELEHLASRLSDLPDQQQSVVLLRVMADLSVQQTAAVLEISPAAVKSAQYRAVKKLREMFVASATEPDAVSVTEMK